MVITITGHRFTEDGKKQAYFTKTRGDADKAWQLIVKAALMGYQDVRATLQ